MAQETQTAPQEVKEKKPLFGKQERRLISDPLTDNNPITVQVLGICSALAVTTLVYPSIIMAVAVIFVMVFANLTTSVLRNYIPKQVRMIVQLVIIASLVTMVELSLKALNFAVYKQLSVFIGLIITNCIIMGRLEAFALANKPWQSMLDGLGNAVGYGAILIIVAFFREVFGKGSLFAGSPIEFKIIGPTQDFFINTSESMLFGWYTNNNLMVLSVAAMFIIAIMIWIQRSYNPELVDVS